MIAVEPAQLARRNAEALFSPDIDATLYDVPVDKQRTILTGFIPKMLLQSTLGTEMLTELNSMHEYSSIYKDVALHLSRTQCLGLHEDLTPRYPVAKSHLNLHVDQLQVIF